MWLIRPPGVYRAQEDTWLLGRALRRAGVRPGGAVLDIGCGTGALSVLAASTAPRSITAVDVSRRAVWATRLNTALRGLPVNVHRGDAFRRTAGRSFDLVLANPPYVPGTGPLPRRGRRRAWEGGGNGRALLDRLCAAAPTLLQPGGILLTVHSVLCDVEETLRQLRRGGLSAEVVATADIPFGPVLRARATTLRERGVLGPEEHIEGLVVVRGERPAR